jgi:hypothetical protein
MAADTHSMMYIKVLLINETLATKSVSYHAEII